MKVGDLKIKLLTPAVNLVAPGVIGAATALTNFYQQVAEHERQRILAEMDRRAYEDRIQYEAKHYHVDVAFIRQLDAHGVPWRRAIGESAHGHPDRA